MRKKEGWKLEGWAKDIEESLKILQELDGEERWSGGQPKEIRECLLGIANEMRQLARGQHRRDPVRVKGASRAAKKDERKKKFWSCECGKTVEYFQGDVFLYYGAGGRPCECGRKMKVVTR